MMKNKALAILSGAFTLLSALGCYWLISSNTAFTQSSSQATVFEFPKAEGYINDFGKLLTDEEEKSLSKIAADFEQRTTTQIAVVTVETTRPFASTEAYATKLFNTWGIGQKDKNNGVLLLIVIEEHTVRIEVGLGLEKSLPNDKCKEILQTIVTPRLKEKAFYEAAKNGMQAIINELEKQ